MPPSYVEILDKYEALSLMHASSRVRSQRRGDMEAFTANRVDRSSTRTFQASTLSDPTEMA